LPLKGEFERLGTQNKIQKIKSKQKEQRNKKEKQNGTKQKK